MGEVSDAVVKELFRFASVGGIVTHSQVTLESRISNAEGILGIPSIRITILFQNSGSHTSFILFLRTSEIPKWKMIIGIRVTNTRSTESSQSQAIVDKTLSYVFGIPGSKRDY
jgi:hypothetical protein